MNDIALFRGASSRRFVSATTIKQEKDARGQEYSVLVVGGKGGVVYSVS